MSAPGQGGSPGRIGWFYLAGEAVTDSFARRWGFSWMVHDEEVAAGQGRANGAETNPSITVVAAFPSPSQGYFSDCPMSTASCVGFPLTPTILSAC